MSTETKYYCDRCKKEVKDNNGLTTVSIALEPYSAYTGADKKFEKVSSYEDYCTDCVVKLGFAKKVVKDNVETFVPTTAEKLYDVVSQIVNENTG